MMVGVFGSYNMNFGLITCCILYVTSCDQVTVSAPPGKTMARAGAIISGGGGTAKEKIEAEGPGVAVAGVLVCSLLT
jgi:succinyl-CoA synthetase alpha subunit